MRPVQAAGRGGGSGMAGLIMLALPVWLMARIWLEILFIRTLFYAR